MRVINRRRTRTRRIILLLSAAIAAALIAGCGGSSPRANSSSASSSSGTVVHTAASTTAAASTTSKPSTHPPTKRGMLAFAKCMRAHGVPNFPDPKPLRQVLTPPVAQAVPAPSGGFTANPNSPAYQTASNDCRSLADATPVTQAVANQVMAGQLKFAVCMRAHGVPNYPDPSSSGEIGNDGAISGVNQSSPAFHSAERHCSSFMLHLPGPPGGGPGAAAAGG